MRDLDIGTSVRAAGAVLTAGLLLAAVGACGGGEGGDAGNTAAGGAAASGGGPGPAAAAGDTARATFADRAGDQVGSATLRGTPHGVLLHVQLSGVAPGTHAFHLHETGACAPEFTAAGGHYNPHGQGHGLLDGDGRHAGDLPNIHVPESGELEFEVLADRATLSGDSTALLAGDGSAIVIHAGADDYRTNPAGAAGQRIACAVIRG